MAGWRERLLSRPGARARQRGGIRSLAMTPDGRHVVSGSDDGLLRVWRLAPWRLLREIDTYGNALGSVAVTPDGEHVVAAGHSMAGAWRLCTGEPVTGPLGAHRYTGEWGVPVSVHAALTPDGGRIVTGGGEGTVRVFDLATGAPAGPEIRAHELVAGVAVTPDGRKIVSAGHEDGEDGVLRVWDLADGTPVGGPVAAHRSVVTGLAVTPDSTRAVSGGVDGRMHLTALDGSGRTAGAEVTAHGEAVADVAVTPDSRVVSVGSGGVAHIWDPATPPAAARTIRTESRFLSAVAVSPDGRRFVTASRNTGVLQVWNLPPAAGA
ncbi:WD40 repeat domain-containing protein [Streptomyces sp. MAR4 CNX-425]|uniref:WD40 repeat domain-containing protein n=1 Tax=Streptomyces sp. MAR4 CNX-425 TaxID=3406343 RepID=UPI003B50824A